MNRRSKTSTVGEWTYPEGKIGLIYASDYILSLGDEALGITGSTSNAAAKLKTGWIHPSNNGGSSEWTLARMGASSGYFMAYFVNSGGSGGIGAVTNKNDVNPIFYLTSDVTLSGGIGIYDNPYIIE